MLECFETSLDINMFCGICNFFVSWVKKKKKKKILTKSGGMMSKVPKRLLSEHDIIGKPYVHVQQVIK